MFKKSQNGLCEMEVATAQPNETDWVEVRFLGVTKFMGAPIEFPPAESGIVVVKMTAGSPSSLPRYVAVHQHDDVSGHNTLGWASTLAG